MELNLSGKRVLVSGSSRGIGLSIAQGFLREGAHVALTSRSQNDLNQLQMKLGQKFPPGSIATFSCDFTDTKTIQRLKGRIESIWHGLDVLVCNVGSGKSSSEPLSLPDDFKRIFQTNFDSAVDTTREFYPLLKSSQGNILFIASIAGMEATGAPTDYSVAKSALISFSKNLARKLAADGIRVNCIAPGNVYFSGGRWEEKMKAEPEKIQQFIETAVPLGRFGKPEEIAAAVLFLVSELSSFTTGACLVIDGGQTATFF